MRTHRHPLYTVVGLFVRDIDTNPKVQNRIHTVGFYYWTLNYILLPILFFHKNEWVQWGLFITLMYSNYANWTSDYTGMSASQGIARLPDRTVDAMQDAGFMADPELDT
jgi:hypothetical protein